MLAIQRMCGRAGCTVNRCKEQEHRHRNISQIFLVCSVEPAYLKICNRLNHVVQLV